jgi:predicted DNA-binding protein
MPNKFDFKVSRTNIYLPADSMAALKAISKKTGAPIAELIRRAVSDFIQKKH